MKSKILKKLIVLSFVFGISNIAYAENYKILRVLHVEPLSYLDDKGNVAGFESDLIAEIERRSGISFSSEVIGNIKQGFDDIKAGKADIMAAALSITPEREQIYLFSEPYFIGNPITIISKSDDVKTWGDLADKNVSVQGGSTHEKWLKELKGDKSDNGSVRSVPTSFLGVKEVIQGKADATINDDIIILGYVNTYKEYGLHASIDGVFGQDKIAFLINKDKKELKQKIDAAIQGMKADGTLDKLLQKWWGGLFTAAK